MASCSPILHLLEENMIGVEIGSGGGGSSIAFLDAGCYMYLIDSYGEYENCLGGSNPDAYEHIKEKLIPYEGQHTLIKGRSDKVCNQIPQVDFVFIDGNHQYEFVKKDIELYWPKIKPGGILTGDDYSYLPPMYGGKPAVDEFIANNPGLVFTRYGERAWAIPKPPV